MDGEVVTPRVVACPAGITRATVLELCGAQGIPAVERDLTLAELYGADEAFCSGTMGELAPVTEVHYGEEGLLALNLASSRLYEGWVDRLRAASGLDPTLLAPR